MDLAETLRNEIRLARQAMLKAQARYQFLVATLKKYDGISKSARAARSQKVAGGSARASTGRRRSSPPRRLGRTAVIRQAILDHHAGGLTAADLIAKLKEQDRKTSSNVVFAALSKLKQRKLVVVRNGKYFPTESLLSTESLRKPHA